MNEEPAPASEREPRWTDGIWIFHPTSLFHPIYLRVFARIGATAITGAVTFCVTNVTHFCSLGFKRAEELAPYVVATLAALCVALSRKYRWGLLRVVILVVFYAYAIYGPYVDWVHGPGRSYFPSNDPPDFSFDDVQTELPPKTK